MALGITTREFYSYAGHDGSEIVLPGYPEPICRAGWHPQEAIVVAWKLGFACTPFEAQPYAMNAHGTTPRAIIWPKGIIDDLMLGNGVIECITDRQTGHAVAFSRGTIFDPDGQTYYSLATRGLQPVVLWRVEPR